jgi:hypothetical protein
MKLGFCGSCNRQDSDEAVTCRVCNGPIVVITIETSNSSSEHPDGSPPSKKFKAYEKANKKEITTGVFILCGAVIFALFYLFSLSTETSLSSTETSLPCNTDSLKEHVALDYKWRTGGFENIMKADFTIRPNSAIGRCKDGYRIKDVTITCEHYANSGTRIDSNTRTIYEIFPSETSTTIKDFNMGFINSQATETVCKIDNFIIIDKDKY